MFWKSWNDQASILILAGMPAIWIFGAVVRPLSEQVITASIMGWTLVLQYYWRKKGDSGF